jgi:hypothetical protein
MAEPQIIKSPLSRLIEEGGVSVDVRICRLDNTGWALEIVAEGFFFFAGMLEFATQPGKDESRTVELRKADKGRRSWVCSATVVGVRSTQLPSTKTSRSK